MKKWLLIIILLLFAIFAAYIAFIREPMTREDQLDRFVLTELSSPEGGIYTNYLATEEQLEWATGHEILSESIGLMMLAAYYDDDKDLFSKYSFYLDQYMILPSGVYAWRILENDTSALSANASIDDLRIAKAYYLAYLKWGDELYLEKASTISNGLLEETVSNNILYNYAYGDPYIDLSYLDTHTMTLLSSLDSRWQDVKRESINIMTEGYLDDAFPFIIKPMMWNMALIS